ncbi:hypothetical protein GJ496_010608 [Pomphorhynchus laevis]|nr:hypothetical protein GJ496_010608 [Pomphorhynchus laevis]
MSNSNSVGTLYSLRDYYRAFPCLITAAFSNTEITLSDTVPSSVYKNQNYAIYKQLYPEIPVFVSADSQTILHDPNSIAYFLSNDQLRASSLQSQCRVLEWTYYAERELVPLIESCVFIKSCKTDGKDNHHRLQQATLTKAQEEAKQVFNYLNDYLTTNTFFVNERITLADIAIFSSCFHIFKLSSVKNTVSPLKNLLRWFNTILHQPEVTKALGTNTVKYDFYKMDTLSIVPISTNDQVDKKSFLIADKSNRESAAGCHVEASAAPKSKNPLSLLPKGSFTIDDFKRVYSNQDTEKVALPYFWEHFDPEHYSVWFCSYKFPEELKLTFMTSNLVSGLFQRLDTMRNYAFASMCIFGEDNNSTIAGVWIWRGLQLAFELCSDWSIDYESYTWKKLDTDKPEVKELVNEYLLWTPKDYQGKKFEDGKIFK